MPLKLYMDVHIPGPVTRGLLKRSIDVLTAQEDQTDTLPDSELLNRAAELGRILVTQDEDFLAEAASRQRGGKDFAGLIYAHQQGITYGQFINELDRVAQSYELEEIQNQVIFL